MWIVKIALNRPYTFIVLALLILIMSPVVILRTPTDVFPSTNIPVVAVAWTYTALMILIFLGSWRSTVNIAISIPLSILTSVIVLSFLHKTAHARDVSAESPQGWKASVAERVCPCPTEFRASVREDPLHLLVSAGTPCFGSTRLRSMLSCRLSCSGPQAFARWLRQDPSISSIGL